jgi:alanine racemase
MLVHGKRAPVIGRVCMDLTMLDVGHIPHVVVGDEVVVFGTQGDEFIHVDEIAKMLNTINYEIVSTITSRVPRVYN